jgi:hypothetical protein
MSMRWLALVVGLGVCAAPAVTLGAEGNKAAAEALFNEGRSLMAAGRYADAIGKLKASQDLDPGLGTLLNLAECYERVGKSATAWAQYKEIASLARQSGSKEREDLAEQKSKALEPKLSKLSINLHPDADGSALTISRDGTTMSAAELGVAIPVDPGKHEVTVTAPGKEKWSTSVDVGEGGQTETVEIPLLADSGNGSGNGTVGASAAGGATAPTVDESNDGSTQRVLGIVAGGIGLVGVGVGTFFGLQASSNWSDAKKECASYPYGCSAKGISLKDDAASQATLSTVGFIVGGVGLAAGAVLFFTAGSGKTETVAVGIGPSSVSIKGTF